MSWLNLEAFFHPLYIIHLYLFVTGISIPSLKHFYINRISHYIFCHCVIVVANLSTVKICLFLIYFQPVIILIQNLLEFWKCKCFQECKMMRTALTCQTFLMHSREIHSSWCCLHGFEVANKNTLL